VPASALVPRSKQGRSGGSGGGVLRRTSTVFAKVAARKRQMERETVAQAESARSRTLQDEASDGYGATSRDSTVGQQADGAVEVLPGAAPVSAHSRERPGEGQGLRANGETELAGISAYSGSVGAGECAHAHIAPNPFGNSSSWIRPQQHGHVSHAPLPPASCLADTAAAVDSPAAVDAIATPPTANMNAVDSSQALASRRPTLESRCVAENGLQLEGSGENVRWELGHVADMGSEGEPGFGEHEPRREGGDQGRENPNGTGGGENDMGVGMECEEDGANGGEAGGGKSRGALRGLMDLEAMLEFWDNPVIGAYGGGSSHRILRFSFVPCVACAV